MFQRLDDRFEQAGKDPAKLELLLSRQKKLRAKCCACGAIGTLGILGLVVWGIVYTNELIGGGAKLPIATANKILERSTLVFGILAIVGFVLMFHADQQVKALLLVRNLRRNETPNIDAEDGEATDR